MKNETGGRGHSLIMTNSHFETVTPSPCLKDRFRKIKNQLRNAEGTDQDFLRFLLYSGIIKEKTDTAIQKRRKNSG